MNISDVKLNGEYLLIPLNTGFPEQVCKVVAIGEERVTIVLPSHEAFKMDIDPMHLREK